MKHPVISAVLVSALALVAASAGAKSAEEVFLPGKPLLQQVERIEIELNDGETYSELRQEERGKVRETLVRIRAAAEQYPTKDAMPESVRTEVFNDQ